MKEASIKQDKIIADLETHRAEAQKKHDGLLIEAAQMSDTRIAELSKERDRLTALNNELEETAGHQMKELRELDNLHQDWLGKEEEFKEEIKELQIVSENHKPHHMCSDSN